jgi:hypothetical protein
MMQVETKEFVDISQSDKEDVLYGADLLRLTRNFLQHFTLWNPIRLTRLIRINMTVNIPRYYELIDRSKI